MLSLDHCDLSSGIRSSVGHRISSFLLDEDRENVSQLISLLKSNGTVTSDNFMEVCNAILQYELLAVLMCVVDVNFDVLTYTHKPF